MIDQIKTLRVKIDGLAQLTKELKPQTTWVMDLAYIPKNMGINMDKWVEIFENRGYALIDSTDKIEEGVKNGFKQINTIHKEIEKSYDSLILTKAWLGKILGELGTESPYKSGYKEVSNIEPTADVSTIHPFDLKSDKIYSHIEKVDWLRTEIEIIIKEVENLRIDATKRKLVIYITNTFTHLSEARFWLGFELQRIKEESK